jgi:cyclopropane fatty-acyl-phospholipid synthase-like methyltransferase
MSSFGTQRIFVTEGTEEQTAINFTQLKSLIEETIKPIAFSYAIEKIAKIKARSYFNYISIAGKQRGRISQFTIDNIRGYFSINDEALKGRRPFIEEELEQIKDILVQRFCQNINQQDNIVNEINSLNENFIQNLAEEKKRLVNIIKLQKNKEDLIKISEHYKFLYEYSIKVLEISKMEEDY